MRSLLGYLSPYVRSLELRVADLESRESLLLDRIMLLTTGAPMEIPKSAVADNKPQGADTLKFFQNKVEDELHTSFPSFHDLLRNAEATSFREDAGIEEETSPANYYQTQEELKEENVTAQQSLKRQFQKTFERAKEEYLQGTQPVLTPAEKAASSKPA